LLFYKTDIFVELLLCRLVDTSNFVKMPQNLYHTTTLWRNYSSSIERSIQVIMWFR